MDNLENLLRLFAGGESPFERSSALREIIKGKAAASSRDDPLFVEGISRCIEELRNGQVQAERLVVASDIGRIWASVRRARSEIEASLLDGPIPELPNPDETSDADDRYYQALALQ